MSKSQIFVCFICPLVVTILTIISIFYIKDLDVRITINFFNLFLVTIQLACVFKQGLEAKRMIEESKNKYDN